MKITDMNKIVEKMLELRELIKELESQEKKLLTELRNYQIPAEGNAAHSAKLINTGTYSVSVIQRQLVRESIRIRKLRSNI